MSIEPHYIIFGAGEDTHPDAEYIERIREKQTSSSKVFVIQANSMERNRERIEIEYISGNRPQLRFVHRKQVVWTRTE